MTTYAGGKQRIGKAISEVLRAVHDKLGPFETYWEPFVGMCGVMQHVDFVPRRVGSDAHGNVIEMWRALREGWEPPGDVTAEAYEDMRRNPSAYPPHVLGFVGHGYSFAGLYFASFKPGLRDPYEQGAGRRAVNGVRKVLPRVRDVDFFVADYADVPVSKLGNVLVYCDPPYKGTSKVGKGSSGFCSETFWEWVRAVSANHPVVVSELEAPADFVSIWSQDRSVKMSNRYANRKRSEVRENLFVHNSWADRVV